MSDYKVICPICHKIRMPYLQNSDICQMCYREILDKYAFFKYKDEYDMPKKGTKGYKICEKVVNERKSTKDIAEEVGSSRIYVNYVISRYLVRCDVDGNERPEFIRK